MSQIQTVKVDSGRKRKLKVRQGHERSITSSVEPQCEFGSRPRLPSEAQGDDIIKQCCSGSLLFALSTRMAHGSQVCNCSLGELLKFSQGTLFLQREELRGYN